MRCPHCTNKLANHFEKPIKPYEVERVHALGGAFVAIYAVATVMGECPKHGIVKKTVTRQEEVR